MNRPNVGSGLRLLSCCLFVILLTVSAVCAEEFKTYTSDEYGFSMKYPANWVKVEPGNYYLVFQSPDMTDGVRNRIHVAAHKPVKDPMNVFLQEMRDGITDLQKKAGNTKAAQILDEGEFKSETPGAYYFFLQVYDKTWMDVVIVFFKHEQTLLRISCLAPSKSMEKFQPMFNEVLTSVRFTEPAQPAAKPAPRATPVPPAADEAPVTRTPQVKPTAPSGPPAQPTAPGSRPPAAPSDTDLEPEDEPQDEVQAPAAPTPAPKPTAPRGPARGPERSGAGIIN